MLDHLIDPDCDEKYEYLQDSMRECRYKVKKIINANFNKWNESFVDFIAEQYLKENQLCVSLWESLDLGVEEALSQLYMDKDFEQHYDDKYCDEPDNDYCDEPDNDCWL